MNHIRLFPSDRPLAPIANGKGEEVWRADGSCFLEVVLPVPPLQHYSHFCRRMRQTQIAPLRPLAFSSLDSWWLREINTIHLLDNNNVGKYLNIAIFLTKFRRQEWITQLCGFFEWELAGAGPRSSPPPPTPTELPCVLGSHHRGGGDCGALHATGEVSYGCKQNLFLKNSQLKHVASYYYKVRSLQERRFWYKRPWPILEGYRQWHI